MTRHALTRLLSAATLGPCLCSATQAPAAAAGTQPETHGVATLAPNGPHRLFTSGFIGRNFDVIAGDTNKLERSIPSGYVAGLAIALDNSQLYVSDTCWIHGTCVKRKDLPSDWDAKTLSLVKEITLPSRMLGGKLPDTEISADGSKAYIYIIRPASSVVWADLKKRVVGKTIEIPGLRPAMPVGRLGLRLAVRRRLPGHGDSVISSVRDARVDRSWRNAAPRAGRRRMTLLLLRAATSAPSAFQRLCGSAKHRVAKVAA